MDPHVHNNYTSQLALRRRQIDKNVLSVVHFSVQFFSHVVVMEFYFIKNKIIVISILVSYGDLNTHALLRAI